MTEPIIAISKETQRRFILGKQGLYLGRRWRGKAGVLKALKSGSVIQIDPINIVARNHDISLFGRVLDYQPIMLEQVLYTDRAGFDYGGTVLVHPMEELSYWLVLMQRKVEAKRWKAFAESSSQLIEEVRQAVRGRGPLGGRDLEGQSTGWRWSRSGKDSGLALYFLWLKGELMTHSRKNFDRQYDLRERIAPDHLAEPAPVEAAERFFALRVIRQLGIVSARSWRTHYAGMIDRPVSPDEVSATLNELIEANAISSIMVEGNSKETSYLLSKDLPLLESLHKGEVPREWQPLETNLDQEAVFLAPLEICTARGRALPLFDFEYLWEVYKPQEKRHWGYYTLPILYGSHLVARVDVKLDRPSRTLQVKGFWLEKKVNLDENLESALEAGFHRFMEFIRAEKIDPAAAPETAALPASLAERLITL